MSGIAVANEYYIKATMTVAGSNTGDHIKEAETLVDDRSGLCSYKEPIIMWFAWVVRL
jgi:hypothetical protein